MNRQDGSRSSSSVPSASLYLAVGLGSALGGSLRWLTADLMLIWLGPGLPWGTLLANVTGSFLMGFYAALAGPGGRLRAGPIQRHLVMTGILGGYTSFSIFSLETIQLLEAGHLPLAGLNLGVSLLGWLGAVGIGFALATRLNRPRPARAPS
jgi:fluoride exporter